MIFDSVRRFRVIDDAALSFNIDVYCPPPDRSTVDGIVDFIARDISAVEKEWGVKPE